MAARVYWQSRVAPPPPDTKLSARLHQRVLRFLTHKNRVPMPNDEIRTLLTGFGEPQSSAVSRASKPDAQAQEVSPYPRVTKGNYVVDGAIDTHHLGTDPLGTQKGKNGPEKQKFLCAQCRQKRWVIDSEVGCTAEMTRFTRCMFCVVSNKEERARGKLQAALLQEISNLQKSIEQRMCALEAKLEEKTPAMSGEASRQPAGNATEDFRQDLRQELSSLREVVFRELDGVRSKVARSTTTPQPTMTRTTACSPGGDEEAFIEDAYARVVSGAHRTNVHSERGTSQAPPREEQPSKKKVSKRKRRRRRKRKRTEAKGEAPAVTQQCTCRCARAPNLLIGDSMVGRETGRFFSQLQPANSARAFPGSRVQGVVEEVAKLDLNGDSTLLLSVGGNDLFLRNGKCGSSDGLVGDFGRLIKTAKSKTSRLVVVGLIPRKYRSRQDYSRALGVNRRLESLCRTHSIRFVDPWKTFFGKDNLFQRDGTHFSSHGARVFARLLNSRLYKPVAVRSRDPGRAGPSAKLAGAPDGRITAKRAPKGKTQPETPTLVASGPPKRPRGSPTGEAVSPNQGPSKRRCDGDEDEEDEPVERGADPPPSGNGSPSVVASSP